MKKLIAKLYKSLTNSKPSFVTDFARMILAQLYFK
jgi:hypothetical protein